MKHLAIDMSSFLWRALLAGTDKENGIKVFFDEKTHTVNSAVYGYENLTSMLCKLLRETGHQPIDTILVFEGRSSKSRRMLIDSTYKGGGAQTRPPEAYEQFHLLRTRIGQVWRDLGATALIQDLAEGDDTLAWLAREYPGELTIATYDGDLTVLNTEDGQTNAYGGTCKVWIDGNVGLNKYGSFEYRRTRIYKALVGDSSDGIKGCAGMGPETFFKLVECVGWDGIDELEAMLDAGDLGELHALAEEDSAQGKLLKKLVKSEESVIRAWKLVQLRPDWIDTMQHPLQWVAGKVALLPADADERLADWYGSNYLITADNYQDALDTLAEYGPGSPFVAFDIETSSSDESDDWLEASSGGKGVDVLGSTLTGFSLTFGANLNWNLYISVDHANTRNVKMSDARKLLEFVWALGKEIVAHNAGFEACVLALAEDEDGRLWRDTWKSNGYRGFIPFLRCSAIESSYFNENFSMGLKFRSKQLLDYDQTTYQEVTELSGPAGTLPSGGKLIAVEEMHVGTDQETRRYRMNQLSAKRVTAYGIDDTCTAAALHQFYKLALNLEHSYAVYLEVEIAAIYANAFSYIGGIGFSLERMLECEKEDRDSVDKAWPILRDFLIQHGWEGTVPPTYSSDIKPSEVKEAFEIVTGRALGTAMRTPAKLVEFVRSVEGEEIFASMLEKCYEGGFEKFNTYVRSYFKGEPVFNSDSPVQMKKLMYETLGLPVRLTNKVTDAQRAKGAREGTAKTDDLAIQTAVHYDSEQTDLSVLKAIQTLKQCGTRSKLFYEPYKNFPHWKDGLLHPSTNQCATVTRRNSAARPNYTQWPAKGDGIKFREAIVARAKGRVILSSDSSGQELRLAADLSQDANMLSCYIGDNLRDIHSIVASASTKYFLERLWSYEEFFKALKGLDEGLAERCDVLRTKSKSINFGEIYGMQKESASKRLMISVEEAAAFIQAKKDQFPGVDVWKDKVVAFARQHGYSRTMLGARRHMRDILTNGDKWEISRAERQLSNAEIQSSGAEAIKIALGKCFFSEVMQRCDVYILGSIHDEIVLDLPAEHTWEVGTELVKFMQAPYASMRVPFLSETTVGVDFGKQLKLPMKFSREDVAERLRKLGL